MCKVCRAGGRKAAGEFRFQDVKLECVYKFAYLGDMLNDTGGGGTSCSCEGEGSVDEV